ncbi:MAG TPA: hypothetical protein VHL79_17100 [Ramlibacter sp.]|jgi:hypothetical protein|nr:hypothetical protein [Ramlibacter sp.]
MTTEELDLARFALEQRQFRFERAKAKREQDFLFRNSAVLISGALSLATLAVSVAAVLNTRQDTQQQHDFQVEETKRKATAEAEATRRAENEANRKGSFELLQYVTTHYDVIYSSESDKQVRIRNAMQLAFPGPALERAFAQLAQTAPTTDGPNVWQQEQRREDDKFIKGPPPRPQVGGPGRPAPMTQQGVLAALTEKDRRWEAERLAELAKTDEGTVELLVSSLLPQTDPRSYRFNLYAAYTLARVEGGWKGSGTQLGKVQALKESGNYKDPTFQATVDKALKNFRRAS